jgi:hypothetical protein
VALQLGAHLGQGRRQIPVGVALDCKIRSRDNAGYSVYVAAEAKLTALERSFVEVSMDDGVHWREADLISVSQDRFAWTQWRVEWEASAPGDYVIACRARDEAGNVQPLDPNTVWNRQGMGGNGVQHIPVTVQNEVGVSATRVPSLTRVAVEGATTPRSQNLVNSFVP